MTHETGHGIVGLLGADPTTAGALAACVVATGAAIAIHPRGWAMWAGLGVAMAVLVALPAAWIAGAKMPETVYTDIVGHPLASAFVVALLIMALARPAWAPWFLAAAMGVAFSAGSLLTWPLIAGVGMCIFEWARRTGHPAASLVGGAVWATLTLGGIQTWSVLGTHDTWGWWALTIGLAVASVSAIHTIPHTTHRGQHNGP